MELLYCFIVFFRLFLLAFRSSVAASPHPKLLVVSYDGFRYDYLDLYRNLTPTLNKLKSSSSYAQCLLNVFPTQTFPNHFSIATGVYPGVHGVLGNQVFDKETGKVLSYGYDLFHYNEDIVPIWTLNEKPAEGRHSGVIMWPGSDFPFGNINTTFNLKFDGTISFEKRVSQAIEWFKHPISPANFIMAYFEEPDGTSHAFGPHSPQNQEQIKRVDNITSYILDSLKNNNLTDVNVIFLSDHGMEAVTVDRIIDLRPDVGNIANMYGTSPVLLVYPKPGKNVMDVYNMLKYAAKKKANFNVYTKEEIPEHFQIKNCHRTPPILLVADPPYAFQDLYDGIDWFVEHRNAPKNGTYGVHGYDPKNGNMHPFFIAHGPLFRENFYAGELRTVDLYSLFVHILELREPKTFKLNGTFIGVKKLFNSSSASKVLTYHGLYLYFTVFVSYKSFKELL